MKNLLFIKNSLFMTLIFCLGVVIISCSDNDDMPSDKTITEIVLENNNFSLLRAALVRADLTATLGGSGSFTVFAPNNDAFTAAGLGTENAINAVPVATLRNILLYHVLPSAVASSAIPNASNTAMATVAEEDVYITKNTQGVFINGASVIDADVRASNGYIHVINKVLMPPSGNIVEALMENDNYSLLVAAVLRASQGSTNVAEVLQGNGPFTVFAPNNQAFVDAGFATEADINAADPATLTDILTYHVLPTRVLSSDLVDGMTAETVNGGALTVSLSGGAAIKGNSNPTASNILQADWLTTNGIIHVVEDVLLP